MIMLFDLVLIIVGTLFLVWGADVFLDGVRDLARMLGVSALVLGIFLAGLEPDEMLTAVIASGRGAGHLALGDVLGTNITITTFALGLTALLMPIIIAPRLRSQAVLATVISLCPIVALLCGATGRFIGVLLILLFIAYTVVLILQDRRIIQYFLADDDDDDDDEQQDSVSVKQRWFQVVRVVGGLLALAVGGPLIVEGALRFAGTAGLNAGLVGATIVSLGTGAEMIVLGITAARKRHTDVLVGGILGSFAYNLLVTLGLAMLIRPLPALSPTLLHALWLMVAVHIVVVLLIWRGKIGRWLGGTLVLIYILYLVTGFVFK
ncbi:MAG TPA: sodium:calcium antiporter [Dictyobacter sp.]|jgi:cation:H+ antiporter|nr:sodium:calcium antiporter [Dictyobacter sp.]